MANKSENYQPGVRFPVVQATFNLHLAKVNYEKLLQDLSAITITRDNVNEDFTKVGREVLSILEEKKDEMSKEPLQWHRDIMMQYKSVKNPLQEQIDRIDEQKKQVAMVILKEQQEQIAEQTRVATAQAAIPTFTNKIAQLISIAKTDDDVVHIEKSINWEKKRTTTYQEFLPQLIEACDALRPQIKTLKETIRQLQELEKKEETVETKEQKEHLEAVIQETGIRISEKAFEQVASIEVIVPEVVDIAPKGRSNWKWRVDDINLLKKKMPHMVKLVPNEDEINSYLTTRKNDGSLEGKLEEKWNGITFYNDKTFKR